MIRLLACDLDGTLSDREGHISPESLAALARARAEGILVVIATGRLPFVLGPFLDRVGVTTEPFIAAQGALVGYRDGRILRRMPLDANVALKAAEIATALGAGAAFFWENDIIIDRYVFPPQKYADWFGEHGRVDADVAATVAKSNGHLIKFMAIHPDLDAIPGLLATLRAELGACADVTRSWHHFVEGATPGADKGAALAWLCQQLGIGSDEVIAIGDGGNDVTMLSWAGHSAAPADADPAAVSAARWLAPALPDHPVAATLAHFLGW